MWERIRPAFEEYLSIQDQLGDPSIFNDPARYKELGKRLNALKEKYQLYSEYKRLTEELERLKSIEEDPEMLPLVEEERESLLNELKQLESALEEVLLSDIPDKDAGVIVEIRAGTGGQEACLFAGDLFRMYSMFAERMKWKLEVLDSHPTELGGFKEVIFSLRGAKAYFYMRFESGVHRVQRVPETEAGGRIHTSAASVVVLKEPEEGDDDIKIDPEELRIDVYRSSGPGGQGVNTADSAVRITHLPTNIVVTCQDERSQLKNKEKAMRVLKARLLDLRQKEEEKKLGSIRKKSIGSGDRSEKIRTYNFHEHRVTDHRIGYTSYRLHEVLKGELLEIIDQLLKAEKVVLSDEG